MSAQNPGRIRRAIHYVRSEPGLLRNVIAVVVVVALGLGIGGTVLANQRFTPPWQGRTQVWATFAEAASVAPGLGQSVQINGVEVGQIADAKIDNKGHALVLMSINQDTYDQPIYQNATVVMRPTTPLSWKRSPGWRTLQLLCGKAVTGSPRRYWIGIIFASTAPTQPMDRRNDATSRTR